MTRLTRRHLLASAGAAATLPLFAPTILRAQEAIRIGVLTPLSGPQQLLGNSVRVGAEIAVDAINQDGGIDGRQVALEIRDSKANPNDATVAARELMGAGINLQLGSISSTVALAMGPLMEGEGGIMITSGAGSEKINHENYSPNVFRIGDNPYTRAHAMVQQVADTQPDVTRWVGIIPDHEYGRTTWAVFVDAMAKRWEQTTGNRPEILDPILVPYGAGDYKTFIAQATRLKPQGIYTSVYGGDAVTLYQQAKPFGLFDNIDVLLDSANEFLVATAMGKQLPRGWTGIHWYYKANEGNPLSDTLYDEYVKRTGSQYPLGWAAEAQAGVLAYKAAIEKVGSTETQTVIDGLKGLTFDSATGPRTLRAEDNQAIKDAEFVFIEPSESAESGFEVTDHVSVDGASIIEPAGPGQKLELTTL